MLNWLKLDNMNKVLIFIGAITIICFSCKKEEPLALPFEEQRTIDSTAVENYLVENNIENVLKDCYTVIVTPGEICDGYVSYVLHEEGNGLTPLLSDNIKVSYSGRLMDTDVEFDANDTIDFSLSGLIAGWQVVLLDMQEGDSVTMYIPAVYGYGFAGSGENIPSNANLIFEMRLHKINQ